MLLLYPVAQALLPAAPALCQRRRAELALCGDFFTLKSGAASPVLCAVGL